jgi:hypothetical protein
MLGIAFEGCDCRAAFHVGAIEWLSACITSVSVTERI